MSDSQINTEVQLRHEHIIDAAAKRFSHFGVNKTKVTEVADDLGISRQSLFYYFTDKNALVKAVLQKVINEFLEELRVLFARSKSVEAGLLEMIEFKRNFFKKYHLMALQDDRKLIVSLTPEIAGLYNEARALTLRLLEEFINNGIEQHELKCVDAKTTSRLLIDTFSAFEHCLADKTKIPDEDEFDSVFDKQKEVLRMILTGLKTNDGPK